MAKAMKPTRESAKRRTKLTGLCESLPETVVELIEDTPHIAAKVRGRAFAYYLVDHQGDRRIAVWAKARPGEPQQLIQHDPASYFIPPYLGPRGWVRFRLDLDQVKWTEVGSLVLTSYRLVAPKRLAALVE